jgi:hypothetical protein
MVVPADREVVALQMPAAVVVVAVAGMAAAAVAVAMMIGQALANPLAAAAVPPIPMQAMLPA